MRRAGRRRLAALGLLVATVAVASGCRGGTMTSYRFGKDSESLASMATEGAFVADGVADGEITSAFARTHAQELADDADKLAGVVDSTHPEPDLAGKTEKLGTLARRVTADLRTLAAHPSDRAVAAGLRSRLSDAADAATKLGESA